MRIVREALAAMQIVTIEQSSITKEISGRRAEFIIYDEYMATKTKFSYTQRARKKSRTNRKMKERGFA